MDQSPFAFRRASWNDAALAAAPCYRGDAGQGAQRVIISFAQRLRGLAEQRGENDPSDARQGSQDRHVVLLGFLPRRIFLSAFGELVGKFIELAMCLLDLLVDQFEARRHAVMWAIAASTVPPATTSGF